MKRDSRINGWLMINFILTNLKITKYSIVTFSLVFAAVLFLQALFFSYQIVHSIAIRTIYRNPPVFWTYYLHKFSICVLIASILPLMKRKWWVFVVDGVIVVWFLSNLIYYRVNGALLDSCSLMMIRNMKGFWTGVLPFMHISDAVLFLPLILLIFYYRMFLKNGGEVDREVVLWTFVSLFTISILFSVVGMVFQYHIKGGDATLTEDGKSGNEVMIHLCPFSEKGTEVLDAHISCVWYSNNTSGIHLLVYDICNLVRHIWDSGEMYSLSDTEKAASRQFFNEIWNTEHPASNLYIILFESLENWAISPYTTPNICQLIDHNNVSLTTNCTTNSLAPR